MPNPTALKFAWPRSRIAETACWTVQLRPKQPTLGSLVVICKEPVTAFSAISARAFAELAEVTQGVERLLAGFNGYERINWLMLMMVDPDVHFHVIPRYAGTREHAGLSFPDAGWPNPPALAEAVSLSDAQLEALSVELSARWSGAEAR
ncbi:HIT family protein [Nevskia ramosa]|uniref:HIT family protein n=1 Tax=Nevskia ramosa TaxID=64002 RepID=UPI0003B4575B|nr:HIT family protein [Nevskia ramosa]